jgi:hypothetical protein
MLGRMLRPTPLSGEFLTLDRLVGFGVVNDAVFHAMDRVDRRDHM